MAVQAIIRGQPTLTVTLTLIYPALKWMHDALGHTPTPLDWEVPWFKRGPGRPRTNWRSIVNKDLSRMGLTLEEAEVAALNRTK